MTVATEATARFACFGSSCSALVSGAADGVSAEDTVTGIRERLRDWHSQFTRFDAGSELCALNRDPRETVPVSAVMLRFLEAVLWAARWTDGLVDGTLLSAIEDAGYRSSREAPLPLALALALAPPRRAGGPSGGRRWEQVELDERSGTVRRPPGVCFDSGGLVKGLLADLLAGELAERDAFAVSCAGDLRVGGRSGAPRGVDVESPFERTVLHRFMLADAGVATSGIGRRSWLDANGSPAHHLLDPSTGRPAYTGIVQATAIAPSALEAEVRAKAALLSGPGAALAWLGDGGVLVYDDGGHEVIPATIHNDCEDHA